MEVLGVICSPRVITVFERGCIFERIGRSLVGITLLLQREEPVGKGRDIMAKDVLRVGVGGNSGTWGGTPEKEHLLHKLLNAHLFYVVNLSSSELNLFVR